MIVKTPFFGSDNREYVRSRTEKELYPDCIEPNVRHSASTAV
ncbi:hypothetical protein NPIL_367431, partial [Nephila pilipes]